MTPLEAKEHLHTKGYCSFNIADLDYKLFDIVNQYKCDSNDSQRENMKNESVLLKLVNSVNVGPKMISTV